MFKEGGGGGGRAGRGGPAFIDQVILASSARFWLPLSVPYLVPFSPLISQLVKVHKKEPMATVESWKTKGSSSGRFKPIEECRNCTSLVRRLYSPCNLTFHSAAEFVLLLVITTLHQAHKVNACRGTMPVHQFHLRIWRKNLLVLLVYTHMFCTINQHKVLSFNFLRFWSYC